MKKLLFFLLPFFSACATTSLGPNLEELKTLSCKETVNERSLKKEKLSYSYRWTKKENGKTFIYSLTPVCDEKGWEESSKKPYIKNYNEETKAFELDIASVIEKNQADSEKMKMEQKFLSEVTLSLSSLKERLAEDLGNYKIAALFYRQGAGFLLTSFSSLKWEEKKIILESAQKPDLSQKLSKIGTAKIYEKNVANVEGVVHTVKIIVIGKNNNLFFSKAKSEIDKTFKKIDNFENLHPIKF